MNPHDNRLQARRTQVNGCSTPGGSNGCSSSGGGSSGGGGGTTPNEAAVASELHVCMGLNTCKGHGREGDNDCAGTGNCATASVHHCHTLNNCRNQGGCGLYGDSSEQCRPGENNCAWQGSCAVPIEAERYSTQGANAGKSTWLLARRLFEDRMERSRRSYGPSPYPAGPPYKWLQATLGSFDSCGNSGEKYCSFGYNDPNANTQEMVDASIRDMPETVRGCCEGDSA
jgi:hypothetical protein